MFYLYVLKSKLNENFYIGFSLDLRMRLQKHNQGKVVSTKRYKPWRLVYYEAYQSKKDALEREKQLKNFAKGFAMLKRRIKNSLDEP
jgi:putative endonuclease